MCWCLQNHPRVVHLKNGYWRQTKPSSSPKTPKHRQLKNLLGNLDHVMVEQNL